MFYSRYIKRIIDFAFSIIVFILLFPVLLVVTIVLIYVNEGRPFFIQKRPGKYEKPFNLIKFKTMKDKRDIDGKLLPDMQRMTKFGSILRRFSLDEILQLINVIKGDLSLIGPRPLLFKYLPLYNERQRMRHNVKPGITGWAQVNGRNAISWKEKFEYDIYYVENISFKLDMKIFFMTIFKIIKAEDINQSSERPMMPFDGTN